MKTRRLIIYLVLSSLILVALACSISYSPKDSSENDNQTDFNENTSMEQGFDTSSIVEEVPTSPVGLNKGLSSLNSYSFSLQTLMTGSTPQDRNDTKIITSTDSVNESSMTRTEAFFSSADEPNGETTVTTNYRVGNVNCTINEDGESEAEVEDYSPAAREMLDILSSLWDVHITAENTNLVGTETISGINTNHYTFTVGGLGQSSGAEVTQSSGDYWTAADGNYLVKYDVVLETRSAPEGTADAEVLRSEVHFLLYDINSTITIQLPAQCN